MALQLNDIITRSLVTSLGRYNGTNPTSTNTGRLIFVKDTVPIPTNMNKVNLEAYFSQFMTHQAGTSTNTNYLGSALVSSSYSYFGNSITMNSLVITPNPDIAGGTVGSVVLVRAADSGAPVPLNDIRFFKVCESTFFITDSISLIDEQKMVILDNQYEITPTSYPTVQSVTISLISAG